MGEKFVPRKRTALDGRIWWCVYDTEQREYSSLLCFGKYKLKREAQYAIDWHVKKGEL